MADGRLARTRVGVLGSGEVGRRLAAGFPSRGHDVRIGSRDPAKPELQRMAIRRWSRRRIRRHSPRLPLTASCSPWRCWATPPSRRSPRPAPTTSTGKVVIDAMNPLDFSGGFPPKLSISGEDSLGERVQRALPDAKVVKAFNTIGNPYFVDPSFSRGQADDADRWRRRGRQAHRRRRAGRLRLAGCRSTSAVSRARASSRRSASFGSRLAAHAAPGTTGSRCSSPNPPPAPGFRLPGR